jgi:hypothetical protein
VILVVLIIFVGCGAAGFISSRTAQPSIESSNFSVEIIQKSSKHITPASQVSNALHIIIKWISCSHWGFSKIVRQAVALCLLPLTFALVPCTQQGTPLKMIMSEIIDDDVIDATGESDSNADSSQNSTDAASQACPFPEGKRAT